MKWTERHDVILLREILLFEPYSHKHGSDERGKCWERIAESLNNLNEENLLFKVTQRSVRDRYNSLEKKFRDKVREENLATGIAPKEETEIEAAIRDIMERFKENALLFQEAANEKTKNTEKDLAQGKEMRRQSLETFSETLKRKSTEDDSPTNSKRSRNTGSETFRFLKEKTDTERELKELELKFRREELAEKSRIENMKHEREKERMQLQQQQMNQQQQLTLAMLQQQQQQNAQVMQQQQQMISALFQLHQPK